MKKGIKFIVYCLFFGQFNFLCSKFEDKDFIGAYERANGELLILTKEDAHFYLTDMQKKNRIYKTCERDEKAQFVGWDDGLTFYHSKNKEIICLLLAADDGFFKKMPESYIYQPTMHLDLSTFQPDYATYNLYVGNYSNQSFGRIDVIHTENKLFWVFNDEPESCTELLPHISSELVTNRVNIFYVHGYKVVFENDLKTMNVFARNEAFAFVRSCSVLPNGPQ